MLVGLRIAGTHLHLCYDGSEPPVSLHVADSGSHHGEAHAEPADSHVDRDVAMTGDYVAKKPAGDLLLPFLVLVFAFALLAPTRTRGLLPEYRSLLPLPARAHLRPPSRGPPALI